MTGGHGEIEAAVLVAGGVEGSVSGGLVPKISRCVERGSGDSYVQGHFYVGAFPSPRSRRNHVSAEGRV